MKASMFLVLIALYPFGSFAASGTTTTPATVPCETDLFVAEQVPNVPTERVRMVDAEIRSLLDAFAAGQIHGIEVVSTYNSKLGGVQSSLKGSPLLRGTMDGPGVDKSMSDMEDEMTALTKIMKQFSPQELTESESFIDKAWGLIGRSRSRASSITASFHSNESKIQSILEGLGNGRAALETDNALLNQEIDRVRDTMMRILEHIEIWKLRQARIEEFRDQLVAEERAPGQVDRRARMKIDLVQNQMLMPIIQTLQMLEGHYDILEAAVIAQRAQQEQNRLTIRTGENLEQTAKDILPTLVTMAVTAARNSQVASLQKRTSTLMENSLAAITKQQAVNAANTDAQMKAGPINQEKIFKFREDVLRIVEEAQRKKGEYYATITAQRERRARMVESQKDLVSSLINSTPMDLLASPENSGSSNNQDQGGRP